MITVNIPQRSKEWFAARRGLPTASRFDKIITAAKGLPSASQDKLINELLAEALVADEGDSYASEEMINGEETEPEALAFYEFDAGVKVTPVGLLLSDDGRFGGSPDGLVGEDGGLEIKCPNAATQIAYLRANKLPDDYKAQVHGYLVVSGRAWWDFLSYRRGLPPFRIRVQRDEFTEKLAAEVSRFCDNLNAARVAFGLPEFGALPREPLNQTLKDELEQEAAR